MATVFMLAVLGFGLYFYLKTQVTIPAGSLGWDGKRTYEPGDFHSIYRIDVVPMHERVTAIMSAGEKPRRLLITWKPDEWNLDVFLRTPKTEDELKRLFLALPDPDMDHHAKLLGIKVLKTEGEKARATAAGVELGEGVEIPY